jgi:hypothetical protein
VVAGVARHRFGITMMPIFAGGMAILPVGALLLRSGPAPATPGFAAPQQQTAPAASGNGDPNRPAEDLVDARTDTSPRET